MLLEHVGAVFEGRCFRRYCFVRSAFYIHRLYIYIYVSGILHMKLYATE